MPTTEDLRDVQTRFDGLVAGLGEDTEAATDGHALTPFFISLATRIVSELPPSRERALALTKLEECAHWTITALARRKGRPPQ